MYLVISPLVLKAGYEIRLYQFLIIAYLFTLKRRGRADIIIMISRKTVKITSGFSILIRQHYAPH